jgi:cytoplasmic iron level regulating protein YaaA (DUF328/UPF0246 family)
LLNLASNEYGKVINRKKLNNPVVDFEFYQTQPNGKLKTIVVYQTCERFSHDFALKPMQKH